MTTNKRTMTGAEMTAAVEAKLTQFSEQNKSLALRMHELILQAAPNLQPRLWYGMPGYAKTKDSAVVLFFREDKYMTFGLTESVAFESTTSDGKLMPCAWYFTELDSATEQKILSIVAQASK